MKRTILAAATAALLSGCASIFVGGSQSVLIQSEPAGAAVTVTNRAGQQVHSGSTPLTVSLSRGTSYFVSEQYTLRFQKDGHAPKEIVITGRVNGWYFGNLLIGGVIGMVVVDPLTGAMFTLQPPEATAVLDVAPASPAASAPATSAAPAERLLQVVALQDLSAEQRRHIRPLAPD